MITSFVHYEGLGIPCTIFKCFNPGILSIPVAMKNLCRLFIFGCVFKPEAVEGAF